MRLVVVYLPLLSRNNDKGDDDDDDDEGVVVVVVVVGFGAKILCVWPALGAQAESRSSLSRRVHSQYAYVLACNTVPTPSTTLYVQHIIPMLRTYARTYLQKGAGRSPFYAVFVHDTYGV